MYLPKSIFLLEQMYSLIFKNILMKITIPTGLMFYKL